MATVTRTGEIIPEHVQQKWESDIAEHRKFDRSIRWHNIFNFVIAVGGIAASFLALEFKYYFRDDDDPLADNDGPGSFIAKVVASLLTLVLIISIALYYHRHRRARETEWYIDDTPSWSAMDNYYLFAEIVICIIHPPPVGIETSTDARYVVVMIARLYLIGRVIRDFTPIYRARFDIMRNHKLHKFGRENFNTLLAIKVLFANYSWGIVTLLIAVSLPFAAYVLFLHERTVQDNLTYQDSLYWAAITMTTVGYGDYTPQTGQGRAITAAAAVVGIILAALLVTVIMETLAFGESYDRTYSLHQRIMLREEQMDVAATVIQQTWRFMYTHRLREKEKHHSAFNNSIGPAEVPKELKIEMCEVPPLPPVDELERSTRKPMSAKEIAAHNNFTLRARKKLAEIQAKIRTLEHLDHVRGDHMPTHMSLIRGVRADVSSLSHQMKALAGGRGAVGINYNNNHNNNHNKNIAHSSNPNTNGKQQDENGASAAANRAALGTSGEGNPDGGRSTLAAQSPWMSRAADAFATADGSNRYPEVQHESGARLQNAQFKTNAEIIKRLDALEKSQTEIVNMLRLLCSDANNKVVKSLVSGLTK